MNSIRYIDIHAHLNFPDYDTDREEVIRRAVDQGVAIINIGTHIESSKEIIAISDNYAHIHPHLYAIPGIHPTKICDWFEEAMSAGVQIGDEELQVAEKRIDTMLAELGSLVNHKKVVGIGECGIDVFRVADPYKKQILDLQGRLLRGQIEIALAHNLPLMIHVRESYREILEIFDEDFMGDKAKLRGNIHFFAGSSEEAVSFLQRGFTVSFTGVVTFAKVYEEIVKNIPEGKSMSETDCPFVAPVPYRGKRNEPVYVIEVVKKMAQIRGISEEDCAKALLQTAIEMFALPISKNNL
jgi:TatD DNase family protein